MFRSPLVPIFLTVFVDVLGLTLMLPLLPYYARHFGVGPLVVTCLGASYAACQLVAGPILGRLSDRVGRKPVLLASQMGTLAALLIIAGASWVDPKYGLAMLFTGRIIDGLTAGNLSIAQAYISDVTKPENRTRAFALIGIAFGSGFLIGPAISGVLAHRFGHDGVDAYWAPACAAAALSFTSIVFTATLLPGNKALAAIKASVAGGAAVPAPPAGQRTFAFGRFFSRPLPRRRLLQFFAFTTSFAVLTGGLALFLMSPRRFNYNVEETGWVFAASGLVGGLVQGGLIGRLVKKIGEERLALTGFVSMAAGYVLLAGADGRAVLFGAVVLSGFGVAVVRPSLTTLLTKSVGRDEQGAALGTSQSLASISQIVGQPTAGFLIEHEKLGAYGLAACFFALIGVVLSLRPEPVAGEAADSV